MSGFVHKMSKKLIIITTIAISAMVLWIYWNAETEFNSTIKLLRTNHYLNKGYLIEPDTLCRSQHFLVIMVTSYVGHVELRSAHRRAMSSDVLSSMNATRVFLLARIPKYEKYISQEAILDESSLYGDILQGTFIENYKNLTLKHLMGLQWTSRKCATASFILKVDDDTVFSLDKTYELLLKLQNTPIERDQFLMGYMLNNTKPRRMKQNKWYVSQDEYPLNEYPPYLSGWYYILTPTVAARLCEESIYHTYFWIDDILITGVLAEALNIKLRHLPDNYWLEYYELLECCLKDMITKYIKCDYAVGPNGGRNNLISEYNEALQQCYNWKNCTVRSISEPLNKVCVTFRERSIFSSGKAEIQIVR